MSAQHPADSPTRSEAEAAGSARARRQRRLCVLLPVHWAARMGGSQYQAKLLIDHLLKHYNVEITYLATRTNPEYRPEGYDIVQFSTPGGVGRYGTFFDASRLYRALQALRPDVIYQQVGCAHTGIAAFYAKRHGCRMLWRVSSDRSLDLMGRKEWRPHRWIEHRIMEYGIRNADVILAQTKHQQMLLARNYERSDAVLVRNFHPLPRESIRKDGSSIQVVWIGNLKPLKNPEVFIRLASRFSARADLRFVMIGGRIAKQRWVSKVLGLMEQVQNLEYLGERTQEEVNEVLSRAHVLVNTSDYEGFSNTFVQAWLRRVPVVSLRVNPDSLLEKEGLGFVSGSEDQLYRDVEHLVSDRGRLARLGERCYRYGIAHHAEANIDTIAELIGLMGR